MCVYVKDRLKELQYRLKLKIRDTSYVCTCNPAVLQRAQVKMKSGRQLRGRNC